MSNYHIRRYLKYYERVAHIFVEGHDLKSIPGSAKWRSPHIITSGELKGSLENLALGHESSSSLCARNGSSGETGGHLLAGPSTQSAVPCLASCPSLSSGSSSADDPADQIETVLQILPATTYATRILPPKVAHDVLQDPTNDTPEGQHNPAEHSRSPEPNDYPETDDTEPALYNTIRTILARDSSYASLIISAIERLPQHKRFAILAPDCAISPPSDGENTNTTASSDKTSSANGGGTGSSTSFNNSSKKRSASSQGQPNQDQGDGGDDGEGNGSGGRPPSAKQRKLDEVRVWICPFCHAFRSIDRIPRFKTCRPFGNLKSRKIWSEHLRDVHSPRAAAKDDKRSTHSLYYMSEDIWTKVQSIVENASKSRPREEVRKLDRDTKCFFDVWGLIFPQTQHPTLKEPPSPFWSVQPAHHVIEDRLQIMLEAIFVAKATAVVKEGTIASEDDFKPTHQEYMEMSKYALTILTSMSDTMSRAVVESSDESLQAAITAQLGNPSEARLPEIAEDEGGEAQIDMGPASRLPMAENNNQIRSPHPAQESVTVIPLHYQDADVRLHLVSAGCNRPELRITVPSGTALRSFSQYETRPHNLSLFHMQGGTDIFSQPLPPPPPTDFIPETLNPMRLTNASQGNVEDWPSLLNMSQFDCSFN